MGDCTKCDILDTCLIIDKETKKKIQAERASKVDRDTEKETTKLPEDTSKLKSLKELLEERGGTKEPHDFDVLPTLVKEWLTWLANQCREADVEYFMTIGADRGSIHMCNPGRTSQTARIQVRPDGDDAVDLWLYAARNPASDIGHTPKMVSAPDDMDAEDTAYLREFMDKFVKCLLGN